MPSESELGNMHLSVQDLIHTECTAYRMQFVFFGHIIDKNPPNQLKGHFTEYSSVASLDLGHTMFVGKSANSQIFIVKSNHNASRIKTRRICINIRCKCPMIICHYPDSVSRYTQHQVSIGLSLFSLVFFGYLNV